MFTRTFISWREGITARQNFLFGALNAEMIIATKNIRVRKTTIEIKGACYGKTKMY